MLAQESARMTDYVLTSLTKRRAELLLEAKAADEALERILADIDHVDGAIRLYAPANRPAKPTVRRAELGMLSRGVLGILRTAQGPLTTRQIALSVMDGLRLDRKDHATVVITIDKVRAVLLRQQKSGVARTVPGDGEAVVWEAVR